MENSRNSRSEVYSSKIRAGKRTYFFDVKATRGNDYYITITESKRRFGESGYDKHKIFLYKEDFNKFLSTLEDTINHVKTELLPDYDYEEFDREAIMLNSGDGDNYSMVAEPEKDKFNDDDDNIGNTWDD